VVDDDDTAERGRGATGGRLGGLPAATRTGLVPTDDGPADVRAADDLAANGAAEAPAAADGAGRADGAAAGGGHLMKTEAELRAKAKWKLERQLARRARQAEGGSVTANVALLAGVHHGAVHREPPHRTHRGTGNGPRNPEGTGTIMKTFITALLIGTAALFGAAGVAHADPDPDVLHACEALMHQPQDAYVGPNHAVLDLVQVYGMNYDHAMALVGQLIVVHTNDPAGWRPSQTCFDLWHPGYIK
jgi:hypothetical protein